MDQVVLIAVGATRPCQGRQLDSKLALEHVRVLFRWCQWPGLWIQVTQLERVLAEPECNVFFAGRQRRHWQTSDTAFSTGSRLVPSSVYRFSSIATVRLLHQGSVTCLKI
jgi:hypothetical protein